jgi:hypothetical protein
MPAALVTACCSAMPTSTTRSGWRCAKRCSPTGMSMAAVIPTTSSRSLPISAISSAKTSVHVGPDAVSGRPVPGSRTPMPWKRSASSFSAGA